MMNITFGDKRVFAPQDARIALADLGVPVPADFHKANTFTIPSGEEPARGYLLMLREDLNATGFLDGLHNLTFSYYDAKTGATQTVTWKSLVICKEPINLTPSNTANATDSLYLVEIADYRSIVKWQAANKLYNVSSNVNNGSGGPTVYLATSLNAGTAWTWTGMIGDLWALMSTQLGAFPGLPITPDGTPLGWIFEGTSAWAAINELLRRIGCTVKADLTQVAGSQYTIVQIGAADAASDAILAAALAANRKIHDAEYLTPSRGTEPYGVRVFFHKVLATPTQIPPFLQNAVPYSVDVVGPNSTLTESGVYHPIWDDGFAIYDSGGAITNAAACATRAAERSADFYRMINDGGNRLWKRYSGLLSITPGSLVRSVSWQAVVDEIFTDILRWPGDVATGCCDGRDYASAGTVQDLIRLGFPSTTNPTSSPTTTSFVIPAVNSTVSVSTSSTSYMTVGDIVNISDGTNSVYGYVQSITNGTTFVFKTAYIKTGAAGNTMAAGSIIELCCKPLFNSTTSATFVIPAIGAPVTITTDNTAWMTTNQEVMIYDGTNLVYGFVTVVNGTSFTFYPTKIESGAVGNTVALQAAILPVTVPLKEPTTATFVIPAIGSPVTVSTASTGWMQSGQEYFIFDGTNYVYGYATPINATSFTFVPTLITGGAVGNTMLTKSTIIPMKAPTDLPTTASFTLPAVGTGVTVNMPTTAQYKTGDTVTIYDGTNNVYGSITIINGTSLTFVPIYFYGGSATNTMLTRAVIKKCCVPLDPLFGKPTPATSSTTGFVWLPGMVGTPTGTPVTLYGGFIPTTADTYGHIWGYISGNWVSLTGGIESGSIASAATVDLATATGDYVNITGSTGPITSFGTVKTGVRKTLKFASTPTLTHSSTIILEGAVDFTAAAGDTMEIRSEGSGNWREIHRQRATDPVITATDGATVTFDLTKGRKQKVTLGGNRTLSLSGAFDGLVFYVTLKQDGTGSRTVTWWANILWPGGTVPTLTTAINKSDDFIFIRISSTEYHGFVLGLNI